MNKTYLVTVILFGRVIFCGPETGFSSPGNAELMMRIRFQPLLPPGCGAGLIQVNVQ
ncbi:hypothetical protein [Deinococcus multiflagellatus]|uniref:Uncharacterized protein n=1 Tax=Deinococcus multiflagellatus TaxID=1656887 RepID=A0ABW1ZTP3_9DEIO|nr:hypothetical protein [Deinococcus multiflagellatus]MBZ9714431.1 hypothetical protein [Deinococcus multiflagellatus]